MQSCSNQTFVCIRLPDDDNDHHHHCTPRQVFRGCGLRHPFTCDDVASFVANGVFERAPPSQTCRAGCFCRFGYVLSEADECVQIDTCFEEHEVKKSVDYTALEVKSRMLHEECEHLREGNPNIRAGQLSRYETRLQANCKRLDLKTLKHWHSRPFKVNYHHSKFYPKPYYRPQYKPQKTVYKHDPKVAKPKYNHTPKPVIKYKYIHKKPIVVIKYKYIKSKPKAPIVIHHNHTKVIYKPVVHTKPIVVNRPIAIERPVYVHKPLLGVQRPIFHQASFVKQVGVFKHPVKHFFVPTKYHSSVTVKKNSDLEPSIIAAAPINPYESIKYNLHDNPDEFEFFPFLAKRDPKTQKKTTKGK